MTFENHQPTVLGSVIGLAATVAGVILAINNPSEQDFRRYIMDHFEREILASDNALAKLAVVAYKDEFNEALHVKRTNFLLLSRYELTLPYDLPGESYCFIGYMNDFRPCKTGNEQKPDTAESRQNFAEPKPPATTTQSPKKARRTEPSDDLPANGRFFECEGLFLYTTDEREVFGSDDGYEFYTLNRGGPDGLNYESKNWPHKVELNMAGAAVVTTSDGRRLDCFDGGG